jgi:hypothetical protein
MNQTQIKKYWDKIEDNPLVIVSRLKGMIVQSKSKWAEDVNAFIDDPEFAKVLALATDIMDGSIPDQEKVARIIVRLEAYAMKFRMQKNAYMSYLKGTDEANQKKNFYFSMIEGIDRLCDGLKYLAR